MKNLLVASLLFFSLPCFCAECPMDTLISSEEIASKIEETARLIDRDYQDKHLTIVMVLKGAICITSDLIRQLHVPFKLECVKASSYHYNGMTAGNLLISNLDHLEIKDRDVLIVDDIFDTGNTMLGVYKEIEKKGPASIKTLTFLAKNTGKPISYRPDYVLFDIPNRFVIGYGLDYKELYRGLPDLCAFVDDKAPF